MTNITVLDGNALGNVVTSSAGATANTRIDGFTIRNAIATNTSSAGIYCSSSSSPTISNNAIVGNGGAGVYCHTSAAPTIANNTIAGNGWLGAVECYSASPVVVNNTIVGNRTGIYCYTSSPAISSNIVAFNWVGVFNSGGTPTLHGNCVHNPGGTNYSGLSAGAGDISVDPGLVAVSYGRIHLLANSPCIDSGWGDAIEADWVDIDGEPRTMGVQVDIGADEYNGTPPMPFTPVIIRVSPSGNDANAGVSWALSKRTVQAGIDAASAVGGEVWVAAGTYNERVLLRPWAYLYGGFAGTEDDREQRNWAAHATILDAGGLTGSVVRAMSGHRSGCIDGFTIRNGNATSVSDGGGGIYCRGASPTIANNTISANSAFNGGGICVSNCAPVISDNIITHNSTLSTGAGIACFSSSPTINHNRIEDNAAGTNGSSASGGGIYCDNSAPIIAHNRIARNGGGGICSNLSSAVISNNLVMGNFSNCPPASGGAGGGITCTGTSSPVIFNNTIIGNGSASYGGGIYCYAASPAIANNTIVKNYSDRGGGIYCNSATISTFSNNVVAFNSSGLFGTGPASRLHNNCVYNPDGYDYSQAAPGAGDISVDPGLVAPDYGQAHLGAGSPCIDAGLDDAVQVDWVDMDGEPRRLGAHVDIGADEYDGTTPSFAPTVVRVSPSGNDANDGSSWALAKLTVQAGIDAASEVGGEVWVAAGTFREQVTLQPCAYVYGGFAGTESNREDRDWRSNATVLDGGVGGSVVSVLAGHHASNLDGFIIRNGTGRPDGSLYRYGGGIYCKGASPNLANNTIIGNTADYGGGLYCSNASPVLANGRITGNSAGSWGGGIACSNGSPTMLNSVITGNSGNYGGGLYLSGSGSPTASNNTIVGNEAVHGGGVLIHTTSVKLSNNIVAFNSSGVSVQSGATPTLLSNCIYNPDGANYTGVSPGTGDISVDPVLQAIGYGQVHLLAGSPCIDSGLDSVVQVDWRDLDGAQRTYGAHVDIGADEFNGATPAYAPSVIRVSPSGDDAQDGLSWSTAKRSLQEGINAAAMVGGEVWVAAGTYSQRITLLPWAYVYGGFAGTESSRAERNWTHQPTVIDGGAGGSVVSARCGRHASCIDGFTIRNGNASYGGGVYCYYGSPAIANNVITENTALANGGGILCTYASPVIANNRIVANSVIHPNNIANGGGICCTYSSATILNNVIVGNTAHGGLDGHGGGIQCYDSTLVVTNNTIVGNGATLGGGIYGQLSSPALANNIVAFNSSGLYWESGSPTLSANCVYNPGGADYTGLSAGNGDIAVDPLLLATGYAEVHLTETSPCIDAGSGAAAQPGWVDMDGQPRIQGVHVDIGADEFGDTVPPFTPIIIRVSPSGDDANDGSSWELAKRTVQAGVDLASRAGGEVWVAAGTYNERANLKPWAYLYGGFAGVESSRSERNWVVHVTVLDGEAKDSVVRVLSGQRASCIDGFTIRNGRAANGAGIYCTDSSPVIANTIIVGNTALIRGGGIYCAGASPTITNSTITGNTVGTGYGGGIYCSNSVAVIANNFITGNAAGNGGAVHCAAATPAISNNTLAGNVAASGGAICFTGTGAATVSNNVVAFNSSGLYANTGASPILDHNCVYNPDGVNYTGLSPGANDLQVDPQLVAVEHGRVHLTAGSPCIDAGLNSVVADEWLDIDREPRVQGSGVDIGADEFDGVAPSFTPTVVRVSPSGNDANDGSSWASAKGTVQAGIEAAADTGGEVWVAAGTYDERILMKLWVHVYGGFAGTESTCQERDWRTHTTTLDGGAAGSVVRALAGSGISGLDGFVVRNGTGTMSESYRYGGGIYASYCLPRIANSVLTDNTAYYGGGISCSYSPARIQNTAIVRNLATSMGGGLYGNYASVTVRDCWVTGNIANNSGGGIYGGSWSPQISNCAIVGNRANDQFGYGGGIWTGGSGSSAAVANCVFSSNSAKYGAGVVCSASSLNLVNCILWGNSGPAVTNNNGMPTVIYCNVQGGWAGTGNIDEDAMFVRSPSPGPDGSWGTTDDDYGDLRLLAGSACIDAGDNAAAVAAGLLVDLDGHGRFFNDPATADCPSAPGTCGTAPIVDMGAYEFIAGDFDRDGDLDAGDVAGFVVCVSGPSVMYAGDCLKADLDRDGDVDLVDYGVFQRCFSGAGRAVDPGCGE